MLRDFFCASADLSAAEKFTIHWPNDSSQDKSGYIQIQATDVINAQK